MLLLKLYETAVEKQVNTATLGLFRKILQNPV